MPLETLPDYRDTTIVVGTTVRKPLSVLQAHLDSLAKQELPPRHRLIPVYVPDFTDQQQDARELLFKWVNARDGELLRGHPTSINDFDDSGTGDAHQWSLSAMARVGANKNLILRRALELRADYIFLCDSDLILDRTTLASLIHADKPITTGVYWTRWSRRGAETRQVHAAPQVWLRHPYELSGRGMDEAEFRAKLLTRDLVRVWGFGACTLIKRQVIEAGVSFEYLPDVPTQGLMGGEDRHFCIRTERLHIEAYADTWPDIFHIYHPEDLAKIPEQAQRLGTEHPKRATFGDLVSLRLRALEPLPVGPGRFQHVQPQVVRDRLGALPLVPELEEAAAGLTRGERQIVRVHPNIHYPLPYMRGRVRLIEITLLDCKSNGFQPVVEDEFYLGRKSGVVLDHTTLNDQQHQSIVEVGNG